MSRRQDRDVKRMTEGQLRRELMRLRNAIRRHRDARDNARCWHNDDWLASLLPEGKLAGRMTLPEKTLLRKCKRYIRRQQCISRGCTGQGVRGRCGAP